MLGLNAVEHSSARVLCRLEDVFSGVLREGPVSFGRLELGRDRGEVGVRQAPRRGQVARSQRDQELTVADGLAQPLRDGYTYVP